jgi:hypothetical protein
MSKIKDKHISEHNLKGYMLKIFSSRPGTWFHDLLDNGKSDNASEESSEGHIITDTDSRNIPRYWHIFIGTNNKYAVAYPLHDKSGESVRVSLANFIHDHNPVKLTSDEERAFIDSETVKLLTNNRVSMYIITEKNHPSLGIIDRFIRTLRDMHQPKDLFAPQSHDQHWKQISIDDMKELLYKYNHETQKGMRCSPYAMHENADLERDYIWNNLERQDDRERIKDFRLKNGTFVKVRLERHPIIGKKRSQYSKECYMIAGTNGNLYNVVAKDGTSRSLPRWRLWVVSRNEASFAKTWPVKGSPDEKKHFPQLQERNLPKPPPPVEENPDLSRFQFHNMQTRTRRKVNYGE